jgi:hypothetical protein
MATCKGIFCASLLRCKNFATRSGQRGFIGRGFFRFPSGVALQHKSSMAHGNDSASNVNGKSPAREAVRHAICTRAVRRRCPG